jgi:TetR/AcrR family transcriptional regulator, copper-responsive repressor
MGRKRLFSREDVLKKALPVFWERGYAGTTVQDLELATGVNKSGLYSEFTGKEDLFTECLKFYLAARGAEEILKAEPLGWGNVERFLRTAEEVLCGETGCFAVCSSREVDVLPPHAQELVLHAHDHVRPLLQENIKAAGSTMNSRHLADMALAFFYGACLEHRMHQDPRALNLKIRQFMQALKQL